MFASAPQLILLGLGVRVAGARVSRAPGPAREAPSHLWQKNQYNHSGLLQNKLRIPKFMDWQLGQGRVGGIGRGSSGAGTTFVDMFIGAEAAGMTAQLDMFGCS